MSRMSRLPVLLVAAVVVAEVAVVALRPRDTGPEPVAVSPRAYFSQAELRRGEDFRGGQRLLFLLGMAVEGAVLVVAVRRPPKLPAVATGAALSLAIAVAGLPVQAIARERAKDVGLVTQGVGGWLADQAKAAGIGAVFAAAGAGIFVLVRRRFGRNWWIPGAATVVLFGAAITYAGPAIIDPLFARFTEVPPGALRAEVLQTAARAQVKVDHVFVVDASQRETGANAYVTGLGPTKRVVLYDNLIKDFPPEEVRFVVAHELGHVRHRDVPRGLLFLLLVAPIGTLGAARLTERMGDTVPAAALAIVLVSTGLGVAGNQLSRSVERAADAFALAHTDGTQAPIASQRRLVLANVGDPDPPRWAQFAFGTHPTAIERIGQAVAFTRRVDSAP